MSCTLHIATNAGHLISNEKVEKVKPSINEPIENERMVINHVVD